jgi:hypothetical protein
MRKRLSGFLQLIASDRLALDLVPRVIKPVECGLELRVTGGRRVARIR